MSRIYFEENGERLLRDIGISKAEFARRMGIHKQNVKALFKTKNLDTIYRASIILNVPFELLIGYTSDGSPRIQKGADIATDFLVANDGTQLVIGGIEKKDVVRVSGGLPFFKDLPIIGWVFSTETETTRHSELVLIARAEIAGPFDRIPNAVQKDISGIVEKVTSGKDHPIRNLGFEQLGLDAKSIE